MKKLSLLLTIISLSVMLVFLGCKKDPPPDPTPTNGQVVFWVASDFGCGNITVTLNGISKAITGFSGTGSPTCGAGEAATFEIAPGTYTYSAACNSKTWNGTVTITSGSCSKIELTGGVAATGQTMFWIASDLGCGNITVTCNGVSKEITGYSSKWRSCLRHKWNCNVRFCPRNIYLFCQMQREDLEWKRHNYGFRL